MSTVQLSYRNADPSDLDALQALSLRSYGQYAQVLTPENWATFESNLQNKQRFIDLLNNSTCFVCLDQHKIVGVAYLVPSGQAVQFFKAEWAVIRMIGVDPEYRGLGIARKLTEQCIYQAKEQQEKTIALHTSEFMDAARHIYESLGFKVLQPIPDLFGKKYWLYTLEL